LGVVLGFLELNKESMCSRFEQVEVAQAQVVANRFDMDRTTDHELVLVAID